MNRKVRAVVILALAVVVVGLAGLALVYAFLKPDPPKVYHYPKRTVTLAPGVVTPMEITASATPQPDGSLAVEQTLVFEATEQTGDVVVLSSSGVGLGWINDDRPGRYWVSPTVSQVQAADVTSGQPADLDLVVDDQDRDDPRMDGIYYKLAEGHDWEPGRHVIEIEFTLTDVWVDIDGTRAMVLPLDFFRTQNTGDLDATIVQFTDSSLVCSNTNRTWSTENVCADSESGEWSGFLESSMSSGDLEGLVAIDPPGVTAEPEPVQEWKR